MENHSRFAISCLARAVKFLQSCVFHLVDALDLPHQELRVAHYFQRFVSVLDGILKGRDQALIFGEIIGLVPQVLAERGDFASRFILDHDSVSCGAGIAAGSAVAVSNQVVLGGCGVRRREQTAEG